MAPKHESSTQPRDDDPFDGDYSEERRAKAVASDAGRKRGARRFSNRNMPVPRGLWRREVEEFDRLRAEDRQACRRRAMLNGKGGSSGGASSSSALQALPPAEEYDGAAYGSSVAPEDFVADEALESITAQVLLRSVREAEERAAQLAREAEIEKIFLHQGLEADRLTGERKAFWEADAADVIDLVSDKD